MNLVNENTVRKLDNLGRIGIPKGIRNRMRLDVEQEMEFYTFQQDGKDFIALAPVGEVNSIDLIINMLKGSDEEKLQTLDKIKERIIGKE